MSDPVLIGIDIGGSVVKAAAFDRTGRQLGCSASPLETHHPLAGRNERVLEDIWQSVVRALAHVVGGLSGRGLDVACLCCTGHGNGLYLLDSDMRPAGRGIVSSDTRAARLVEAFERHPEAAGITRRRGQRFCTAEPSLLMAWIERFEPERAALAAHVVMCKDYVRFRLTGRLETELCDASGGGLLNLASKHYEVTNFERFGIGRWLERMPPIRRSTDLCGGLCQEAARATGLPEGTPVAAGTMDLEAVVLGSGALDESDIILSAGTWNIVQQVLERPVLDPLPLMQAMCRDGTRYLMAEGTPTGASNLSWLLDDLLGAARPSWAEIDAMVDSLDPTAAQVVHLPYINGGPGDPQAAFLGITSETRAAHLLRAVFESTCFMHRQESVALTAVTHRAPERAKLTGGVARSQVVSQLFADVLGVPVEVGAVEELGALGCAILGAVAVGLYPGAQEAVRAMSHTARTHRPDGSRHTEYSRKFVRFTHAQAALAGWWREAG